MCLARVTAAGSLKQLNPRSDVVTVVVERAAADQIAINHTGLIDKNTPADF